VERQEPHDADANMRRFTLDQRVFQEVGEIKITPTMAAGVTNRL